MEKPVAKLSTSSNNFTVALPEAYCAALNADAKSPYDVVELPMVTSATDPSAANTGVGAMDNTMMTVSNTESIRFPDVIFVFISLLLYMHTCTQIS